ncbi:MAG: hypothetical protein ACM3NT_11235, partial [Methylocystaceae bacterium]
RKLIILVTLLAGAFLLSGCGSEKTVPTVNLLSEEAVYTSMMMQLDDSRPDRKPDLCGVVKSIDGKQVTINLAEVPVRAKLTPEEREKLKASGQQPPRQRPALKMTGETKSLQLASNTKIVSFSKQNGRLSIKNMALADLKTEQVLMAWVEGEQVIYVQVFPRWNQKK